MPWMPSSSQMFVVSGHRSLLPTVAQTPKHFMLRSRPMGSQPSVMCMM